MSHGGSGLERLLAPGPGAGVLATLARASLVILLAAVIATLFAHHSVLHGVEKWTREVTARLFPPERDAVVVIDIDDDAYERYFSETSPLDSVVLRRLIDAVAQGGARSIGVDIDTSARRFEQLEPDASWPPVVWARSMRPARDDSASGTYTVGRQRSILGGVLGGKADERGTLWGVPLVLSDDTDRRVRRYLRALQLEQAEYAPTFASRLAHVSSRAGQITDADAAGLTDAHARLIDYMPTERRLNIPAHDVLELASSEGWRSRKGPVAGRIVLIGGTFAGLDRHATPLGEMPGVHVLANVVETELAGGGARQPSWATVFAIEVFVSLVLVLLFHAFTRFRTALTACLLLALVLGPLSSLLVYGSLERWFYFSLVYLAVSAYYGKLMFTVRLVQAKHTLVEAAFDTTRSRITEAWSRRLAARARHTAAGGD
jgi:CHASE2 domain-containing sensor protein